LDLFTEHSAFVYILYIEASIPHGLIILYVIIKNYVSDTHPHDTLEQQNINDVYVEVIISNSKN